jgi:hypothetical protein
MMNLRIERGATHAEVAERTALHTRKTLPQNGLEKM